MKYRELGKSGIPVSEIGFGAWGIGGRTAGATSYGDTDDKVSTAALDKALQLGINFFDTANVYGDGHSESLLGEVLSPQRHRIVISTKAGFTDYRAPADFSPAALRLSLEGSLRRLGTDYVDLLMLHDPDPQLAGLDQTFAEMERLKSQGKIRAAGVSVRTPEDCPAFIERFGVEAIQVNLNLMDQRLIDIGALEAAAAAGCAIIARTPLCFGFLADGLDETMTFDEADHRSRWPPEQLRRWREGRRMFAGALAKGGSPSMAQTALRFCLSHTGVATAIPGIMTAEEAVDNASASELGPLSEGELAEIHKIYCENSFFAERPTVPLAMADK